MQGLHLHLDLPSGLAGDMTLGALFDLGVPEETVLAVLATLGLSSWEMKVAKTLRRGLAATDVKVLVHGRREAEHGHGHTHTHYADIRTLLTAKLEGEPARIALEIFDRLARAEARLHGTTVDDVAFHEVGAIDSIVDIVGTAAAIAWLRPASVSASPVAMGHGTIRTSHGVLPLPAPAALEILREAGAPMTDGGLARELCTPTGAAIVAALAGSFGPMPDLTVRAVGYGAGDDDFPDRPNVARALLGERAPATRPDEGLHRVEANLDDMIPELSEHVTDALFEAGAVDVWWTPVTMKRSRPAVVLSALAPAAALEAVCDVILRETTSIGVRFDAVERRTLDRRVETVETPYGPVAVKVASRQGAVWNVAPEYASCRDLARSRGVPLKDVYAAAIAAWRKLLSFPTR